MKWIPCEPGAPRPEEGQAVLVFYPPPRDALKMREDNTQGYHDFGFYSGGHFMDPDCGAIRRDPIAWTPLTWPEGYNPGAKFWRQVP